MVGKFVNQFPLFNILVDLCALLLVSLWYKYNWPRLTECVLVHLLLISHNMLDMKAFRRLAIIYDPFGTLKIYHNVHSD